MTTTRGAIALLMSMAVIAPALAADGPAPSAAVLNAKSLWRCHLTWKTEMVRSEAGGAAGQPGGIGPVDVAKGKPAKVTETDLPPANWAAPDFDDGGWMRMAAPIQGTRTLALICLRGKFEVKDPAAAGDLELSLAYRGGAVAYLNGQEIARGNLPGEKGKADLEALATDYPKDAYVDPENFLLRTGFGDPDKHKDRFALRDRRLAAKLPRDLLRKGVNVLALELHRAPTLDIQLKGRSRSALQYSQWAMLGFLDCALNAPNAAAVTPNVSRAAGLQVWNHSVMTAVDPAEYADPNEPLGRHPVRIVGCRNGSFSGQLVAGSTDAIKGLKAEPSALNGPGGTEIPASAVQVRWPRTIPTVEDMSLGLDALETAPPAEAGVVGGAAIQPIFVTVNIPRDAKPGDYIGKLSITAGSATVDAAIQLKVVDWTLPDAKDFCTHAGLAQSPDTLAIRYNVPLWSDAHWKLIDQSFTLLAQVGAREVFIPLICQTHHGNEQTMVRWIKDGDGYKYDYAIAEKYLDTAIKRLGKVSEVGLYIWDRQGIGSSWGKSPSVEQKNPARVTLLDPATGKVTPMDAPKWGTPESVPFWKPVFAGMRDRLKARGLEQAGQLAMILDSKPLKATIDDLAVAAPGLKYMVVAHLGFGGPIASWASVWSAKQLFNPQVQRPYVVSNPGYLLRAFPRYGGGSVSVHQATSPIYRVVMESEYCAGNDGFGWVGADFWPCRKDSRGKMHDILGGAEVGNLTVPMPDSVQAVLAPGTAGPVSTIRLEMLREGTQETQAAMLIARAAYDPGQRAKLGDELAARAEGLLFDRAINLFWGEWFAWGHPTLWAARPWQTESEKLYALAGEVTSKLSPP